MVFKFNTDFDQQEALDYRPGTKVQLKQCPEVVDTIAEYDPMMVPPIWLANDPKPRYPEELEVLPRSPFELSWLRQQVQGKVLPPAVALRK